MSSSFTTKFVRAVWSAVVVVCVVAGCADSQPSQTVPTSVVQLQGAPPPNQHDPRPVDTAPAPVSRRPANSLEELVARAIDNSLAVSVTKATVWTVKRSEAEPVFGTRLNRPDEDVYVIALEGRFRWIAPAPPGAIVPDFVDILIFMESVATGAGIGGGTHPDGAAVMRVALGPGTEIPLATSVVGPSN